MEATHPSRPAGAAVATVGFGTAVAMWGVGYVGRLPAVQLAAPRLLVLFLALLLGGGLLLGRRARLGFGYGAAAGLVTGLLNLLVLGGLVSGERGSAAVPSWLLWLPGSILVAALLPAIGAFAGERWLPRSSRHRPSAGSFAWVAVGAALLLLGVGGIVTSTDSGLAVADWPNSFGYNMFLYPFSRMTGGIYYEHAHRLFGALVGLTTLTLAGLLQWLEPRRWLCRVGWLAVAMVILQGILGGLRVTGSFTWSQDRGLAPNIGLAVLHGVLGQLFFATLVAIAVAASPGFVAARAAEEEEEERAGRTDRLLALSVVGALFCQLVLGAVQRHLGQALLVHIVVGLGVVLPLAVHSGFRAWGSHRAGRARRRTGLALVGVTFLQVFLGISAFLASYRSLDPEVTSGVSVATATAHQWLGAVLLGTAVALACWTFRPHQVSASAGGEVRVY